MKSIKKIFVIVFSLILLTGAAGCKGETTKKEQYTLYENAAFRYEAVLAENADGNEEFAAAELKTFLYKATGKQIAVIDESAAQADGKYIYIGRTAAAAENKIEPDKSALSESGYILRSVGDEIYAVGATTRATVYAIYDLLNRLVNYEVYTYDEIYVDKTEEIKFSEMNVAYKPFVEWRNAPGGRSFSDMLTATRLKLNMQKDVFIMDNGVTHTSFNFVNPNTYAESHPEWFDTESAKANQLCYTAHGDKESLAQMQQVILEKMQSSIEYNIQAGTLPKYISFTHQDNNAWCACDTCKAAKAKYGTNSAVVVQFVNELSTKLNQWLAEKYHGNIINIVFFAYYQTELAPVKKDKNGNFLPVDDSVVVNKYSSVWYAPIYADYGKPLTHQDNQLYYDTLRRWSAICDDLLIWTYPSNYNDYFVFHDSFGAMFETYAFADDFNIKYFFDQGRYNITVQSNFEEFKTYLCSKLLWNIDCDYTELRENFFDNYYGSASDAMQNIFEQTRLWYNYMQTLGYRCAFGVNDAVSTKYWPQSTIENFISMFESAYAAIEPLKQSNPTRYQVIYDRISKEEVAYTHLLLELYDNNYSDKQLAEMQNAWKTEVLRLGFTHKSEGVSIDKIWENW